MNPKPCKGKAYTPTSLEHRANICTHGVSIELFYQVFFKQCNGSKCSVLSCTDFISGRILLLYFKIYAIDLIIKTVKILIK